MNNVYKVVIIERPAPADGVKNVTTELVELFKSINAMCLRHHQLKEVTSPITGIDYDKVDALISQKTMEVVEKAHEVSAGERAREGIGDDDPIRVKDVMLTVDYVLEHLRNEIALCMKEEETAILSRSEFFGMGYME